MPKEYLWIAPQFEYDRGLATDEHTRCACSFCILLSLSKNKDETPGTTSKVIADILAGKPGRREELIIYLPPYRQKNFSDASVYLGNRWQRFLISHRFGLRFVVGGRLLIRYST